MRTPRVSETEPRTRVRKSGDRRSRVRRRAKKNGAGAGLGPAFRRQVESRGKSFVAISQDESPLRQFRAKYRGGKSTSCLPPGRCGTSFPASLRTAPRPLADERGSSPRPRRDATVIASAQRAARANSSTTAAARAFCPGAVWKLRGCSPAPRPRAAAPPPRAHRAGGRLGVGDGPRLAFLCVSGTTRARARGSQPAPAPRRAPTRCPSRPPRTNRWRAGRGRARMRERRRVRLAGFPTRATREMHGRTLSAETIARRLG